jgi:3',5'-cyclic AMP phosphodiesterase CpdA
VLAHCADVHFGAEDTDALAAFAAALRDLPDATVVVAGDLTYEGRRREFQAAADWLTSLERPVILTPGNHDVPVYNLFSRLTDPFNRHEKSFADHDNQTLFGDDFALLSLNTARGAQWRLNWAHGAISNEQAEDAVACFQQSPTSAVRTIVCHHPLVIPPGAPIKTRTRGGPEAATIMAEGGVDLVLTGHLHRPFVLQLPGGDGKTWSVGAGTLSERQRGDPASFTVLTREGGDVRVTAWRIDGSRAAPAETALLELRPRG